MSVIDLAYDPFAGIEARADKLPRYERIVADLERTKPALVKRAAKRVVVDPVFDEVRDQTFWHVEGQQKLGDTYPDYRVTKTAGIKNYDCSCHHTDHGQSRARSMCSHVLAVLLWRREHPDYKPAQSGKSEQAGKEATEQHQPNAAAQLAREKPAANRAPTAAVSETDLTPWATDDERLTPGGFEPMPEWAKAYRESQWSCALETVAAFNDGVRLVFADMPTGAGKGLYGDLVARLMQMPAVYMCTTKTLQDQMLRDFEYAKVLKGRANYPTLTAEFPEITCDDCDGNIVDDDCTYCPEMRRCPYRVAKQDAIRAQLAVVNMAYWLREANHVGGFSLPPIGDDEWARGVRGNKRRPRDGGLFIIDECDTVEDQILGYVEFSLTRRRLRELGLTAPKKQTHKSTIRAWMENDLIPAVSREMVKYNRMQDLVSQRRARGLDALKAEAKVLAEEIESENWIRDYEREDFVPFSYKPIRLEGHGNLVWNNVGRVVMMSATIISPEEMARSLGWDEPYAVVRAPMAFPVKNRPIRVAPVADMSYKTEPAERPKMATAIEKILAMHGDDDRVLVHCVSYGRAQYIMENVETDRALLTYKNASEREETLAAFLETPGSVLVAPSFERGVDLKDDACRVQIVAKVPYPGLGDQRTNRRMHGPDGEAWYAVQTIRSLVQMTGRSVRTEDDYCETYILDSNFARRLLKHNRSLLPTWWRDALDTSFNVRQLL